MQAGSGLQLVEAVREAELDAAVVSLPAPTAGLRVTPLGDQHSVAVFRMGHDLAVKSEVRLDQIAPERIVVLPRDVDRPFYDAVLAACRAAGVSPTLVDMPDGNIELALLAVASGAGMAVLPECISERYAGAGVRFVPLNGSGPVLTTASVSRRDTEHMPTLAFLRAMSQALSRAPARRPLIAAEEPADAA